MAEKTDAELVAEKRAEELEAQLKAAKAETDKWKAMSRQNEDTLKEKSGLTLDEIRDLRKKAAEFDRLEEANKTDLQKERAAREIAEKALKDREEADQKAKADADAADAVDKLREEVAASKGITPSLLRGSTKEEFEAHADELIKAGIKPAAAPPADGQGEKGEPIGGDGDKSADEIASAVLSR